MSLEKKDQVPTQEERDNNETHLAEDDAYAEWATTLADEAAEHSRRSALLAFGLPFAIVFVLVLSVVHCVKKELDFVPPVPENPKVAQKEEPAQENAMGNPTQRQEESTPDNLLPQIDAALLDDPEAETTLLPGTSSERVPDSEQTLETPEFGNAVAEAGDDALPQPENDSLLSPDLLDENAELFDFNDSVADDAPNAEYSTPNEDAPLLVDDPTPEIDANVNPFAPAPEEAAHLEENQNALNALENEFASLKKMDAPEVDKILDKLDLLREKTLELQNAFDESFVKNVDSLIAKLDALKNDLESDRNFFRRLRAFDSSVSDLDQLKLFLAPDRANLDVDPAQNVPQGELAKAYNADFVAVSQTLDLCAFLDQWNDFVQDSGLKLEKFHVASQDAQNAVEFANAASKVKGAPEELKILLKRIPQWRYDAEHVLATQRKIVLMIESELRQKYWTYAPTKEKIYYLVEPPKVGENQYVSSAQGSVATVLIPEGAPELQLKVSPQKAFLDELAKLAWKIPDSLRETDIAQWYAKWCEFMTKIQTTDDLDPILQYAFLRETAQYLRASDYYFAQRLEPVLRVLNAPQLDDNPAIDRFQTESSKIAGLRALAKSRLEFLPKEHFKVDKTTEQLDEGVERFATLYPRVGWIDRNLNGEWILRAQDKTTIPAGDLYVVTPGETDTKAPRWIKVGVSDGTNQTLTVVSESIPRGSIVFCRVKTTEKPEVAANLKTDALFNLR
ncbi:MAG: hypothetical protein ACI4NP_04805 [Thermoguttaceae bacterium]